eukprot:Rhum_TRINITY_DN9659_c0_g1::Rhum_TRINITY_DN9659_c0_g1_i1::g.34557::m.34557
MFCLAALAAAIGAAPKCSPSVRYCFTKRSGSTPFGDAMADIHFFAATDKESQCSAANYQAVDSCFQDPVLQFKVTHPPELTMTLLYRDSVQTPYKLEMDVSTEGHPLHAKELDVVAVGGPVTATDKTRRACNPSDFNDKSYA